MFPYAASVTTLHVFFFPAFHITGYYMSCKASRYASGFEYHQLQA